MRRRLLTPKRQIAYSATCFVLSICLRANSLRNGLVWDDKAAIVLNRDVTGTSPSLLQNDYWGQPMVAPDSHKSWRPLSVLSFRLNHKIHGLKPMGYHLLNVLLHGASSFFVARLSSRFTSSWKPGLLFACHPIHTEVVASAVGRADVLCGLLYFVSLDLFFSEEVVAAYAFAFFSALAKEVGVFAFCSFAALDFFKRRKRSLVSFSLAVLVVLLHAKRHGERMMYEWTLLENGIHATFPRWSLPSILSYAHVAVLYLYKLVWPFSLCYDYGYPCVDFVTSPLDPRNLQVVLCAVVILWLAKKHYTLLLLGVVPLIPALHVLAPVGTVLGERLLYVPSFGFCCIFSRYSPRWILILFAIKSFQRNRDWNNERELFESAMSVCPTSLKVQNNLALTLLKDDPQRAERLLDDALETYPEFRSALYNRGLARHQLGKKMAAISDFERALLLDANDARAHTHIGQDLWLLSRDSPPNLRDAFLAEAENHLSRGDAELPVTWWARASVALDASDFENAAVFAQYAREANRRAEKEARVIGGLPYNLHGLALKSLGDTQGARRVFEEGLSEHPDCFDLLSNAASLYAEEQQEEKATELFNRALALQPEEPLLLNNIGYFLEKARRLEEALSFYKRAEAALLPQSHPQITANIQLLTQTLSL